jgi:pantoate--beta-alanine ligase
MQIIRTIADLRSHLATYRKNGETIGFAPTMGALHSGHLSLVEIAKQHADKIVVSIFVNPAQFAPHEDFDKYPRTEEQDLAKLKGHADIVYLPSKEELYPQGFDIKIATGKIGQELEGITRPHFFDGVALVVTKLFMQVQPDVAVFGEKDFQQLHIIRKVTNGFDMPIEIIGAPIIRERDGLAMSSRNVYLSETNRKIAPALYQALCQVKDLLHNGKNIDEALEWGRKNIVESGFSKLDYLELRSADTLSPANNINTPTRLLVAAYLGETRLIDNIAI